MSLVRGWGQKCFAPLFFNNVMKEEEIKKLPRKNISVDKFYELSKRMGVNITKRKIHSMGNGAFLCIYSKNEGKTFIRLHLKMFWIKQFNMKYSNHPSSKSGRELLMSNLPLPQGRIVAG